MKGFVGTLLVAACVSACGGTGAGSSTRAHSTQHATTAATAASSGPSVSDADEAVASTLNSEHPSFISEVDCTHPTGVWRCTDIAASSDGAVIQVSGSGPTVEAVEAALGQTLGVRVQAHKVAVVRAKARRARQRRIAARRAAQRRAAADARLLYCRQLKQGEHNGLSIAQVLSYCGKPDHRQHLSVPGLTTDFLYYGGFTAGDFGGRTYQLAFTNGLLTGVNYY